MQNMQNNVYWNWPSCTSEYSQILNSQILINSDDPNEQFETGYRNGGRNRGASDPTLSYPTLSYYKDNFTTLFADGPKLKFIASNSFTGSIFGYVFYKGDKGLGYYIDPLIMKHVYNN